MAYQSYFANAPAANPKGKGNTDTSNGGYKSYFGTANPVYDDVPKNKTATQSSQPKQDTSLLGKAKKLGKDFYETGKTDAQKAANSLVAGTIGTTGLVMGIAEKNPTKRQAIVDHTNKEMNYYTDKGFGGKGAVANSRQLASNSLKESVLKPIGRGVAEYSAYTPVGKARAAAKIAEKVGVDVAANSALSAGTNAAQQKMDTGKVDLKQVKQAAGFGAAIPGAIHGGSLLTKSAGKGVVKGLDKAAGGQVTKDFAQQQKINSLFNAVKKGDKTAPTDPSTPKPGTVVEPHGGAVAVAKPGEVIQPTHVNPLEATQAKATEDVLSKIRNPKADAEAAQAQVQAAEQAKVTEKATADNKKLDDKIELVQAKAKDSKEGKLSNVDQTKIKQLEAQKTSIDTGASAEAMPAAELSNGAVPEQVPKESAAGVSSDASLPPDAHIVNPIDRNATPQEKVRQLGVLTAENEHYVKGLTEKLDAELGTASKHNLKDPEKILEKSVRPSILAKKPWHGVEHIRDGLRFKTVIDHPDQIPKIVDIFKKEGITVVKHDTDMMVNPKEYGWRAVVLDLRMPNGQLVEHYIPFKSVEAYKNKIGHKIFEKWRNKAQEYIESHRRELREDQKKSFEGYDEAYRADLVSAGTDEAALIASLQRANSTLESMTLDHSAISSTDGVSTRSQVPEVSRSIVPESKTANKRPSSDLSTKAEGSAGSSGKGVRGKSVIPSTIAEKKSKVNSTSKPAGKSLISKAEIPAAKAAEDAKAAKKAKLAQDKADRKTATEEELRPKGLTPLQTSHMEEIDGYTHSSDMMKDYATMLRDTEKSLTGGKFKIGADGGKVLYTDHGKFYSTFFKEHKHAPSIADYQLHARDLLETGKDDWGAGDTYKKLLERESKPVPKLQIENSFTPVEQGTSKIAKSVAANATKRGITEKFKDLAGYDRLTIADQAEKATKALEKPEDLAGYLNGSKPLPDGLRATSLVTAIENHPVLSKDSELMRKLANSPLASESSYSAQELRLAAERAEHSPIEVMKAANKAKVKAFEIKQKTTVAKATEVAVKEAKATVPKITKETWNSFIESIKC